MARSAFAAQLAEILLAGGPARPDRRSRYPRRGREDSRPRDAHAPACIALAFRDWRRPGAAQARNPPADVLVQDPRRVQRRTAPRRACWRSPRPGHGLGRQPWTRARPRRADVRHAADRLRVRRRTGGQARGDARRGCGPAPVPGLRRGRAAGEGTCRRGEAIFVSPYAHPDVIAGAGTVGLEIVDEWPDVDTIVAAVGGGGLISGLALVARASGRTIAVAGVEAEASAPFTASLAAGRIVEIDVGATLATASPAPRFGDADVRHRAIGRRPDRAGQRGGPAIGIRGISVRRLVVEGAGAAVWLRCSRGGWIPGDRMSQSCCPAPISMRRCCTTCFWIRTRIRRRRERVHDHVDAQVSGDKETGQLFPGRSDPEKICIRINGDAETNGEEGLEYDRPNQYPQEDSPLDYGCWIAMTVLSCTRARPAQLTPDRPPGGWLRA